LSAFWIVESRCAIAIVVLPLAASSSAFWTTFSELESRAEVAYEEKLASIMCWNPQFTGDEPHPEEELWDFSTGHERWRCVLGKPLGQCFIGLRAKRAYVSDPQTTESLSLQPRYRNPWIMNEPLGIQNFKTPSHTGEALQ